MEHRIPWEDLPVTLKQAIEARCGAITAGRKPAQATGPREWLRRPAHGLGTGKHLRTHSDGKSRVTISGQPADSLLRELDGTTFIVIDFEALTPAGRPPEPVEVAAIALACRGGQLTETSRFTKLMRPPADVPVTAEFTRITAITAGMLSGARPAREVMADLERQLMMPGRCRLVAHSAATEAGLLARQRDHCPHLAATPLLDTVRLARAAAPGLTSYRLDSVLAYYGVPRPADRHRALPDTEVTAVIFARLLADGASVPGWAALTDLDAAAGRPPASPRAVPPVQETLFLAPEGSPCRVCLGEVDEVGVLIGLR